MAKINGKCLKRKNGIHLECYSEVREHLICLMCDEVLEA
jgi:hypothetical protein